jgi:hypothetical protein
MPSFYNYSSNNLDAFTVRLFIRNNNGFSKLTGNCAGFGEHVV